MAQENILNLPERIKIVDSTFPLNQSDVVKQNAIFTNIKTGQTENQENELGKFVVPSGVDWHIHHIYFDALGNNSTDLLQLCIRHGSLIGSPAIPIFFREHEHNQAIILSIPIVLNSGSYSITFHVTSNATVTFFAEIIGKFVPVNYQRENRNIELA